MKKILSVLLIAMVALTAFAGGAAETAAQKTYVFAGDAAWPPLEFVDESGKEVGFEVDLLQEIAKSQGVTIEFRNTAWDGIFAGLANGLYDGVASGVTVTEERKVAMDFTTTILKAGQVAFVKVEDQNKYKNIDDLNAAGAKVGVQITTTGDFLLDNYPGIQKRQYDNIGLGVEDMLNGNLDACVCDSIVASDYILGNANYRGKLVLIGDTLTTEDIAIAVNKGNDELLNILNSGIAELQNNGTFNALKTKWNLL